MSPGALACSSMPWDSMILLLKLCLTQREHVSVISFETHAFTVATWSTLCRNQTSSINCSDLENSAHDVKPEDQPVFWRKWAVELSQMRFGLSLGIKISICANDSFIFKLSLSLCLTSRMKTTTIYLCVSWNSHQRSQCWLRAECEPEWLCLLCYRYLFELRFHKILHWRESCLKQRWQNVCPVMKECIACSCLAPPGTLKLDETTD